MSLHIQYAAHVDHGIAHTSEFAQISLGLAAAVVATIVVVATGGTALIAFSAAGAIAAAGAAGTVATAGSLGIAAGSIIDNFVIDKAAECWINTGHPTLLLGPESKPAGRADHADAVTRGRHTNKKLLEGSELVTVGPEIKPMSRRGDRSGEGCGGVICEGLSSLLVGGTPSSQGTKVSEESSTALWAISLTFDLVGAGSTAAKGGVGNIIRGVAQGGAALIGGDTANYVGVATLTKPQNVLDAVSGMNTIFKGGQSAVSNATSLLGP